jgi:hypothetical protein
MAAPIGNQNARKAKIWEQALKRALARYSGATVDAGLDKLADRMVKAAAEGDDAAWSNIIEKIGDRMDGKPAQAIVGDSEADPIGVALVRREVVRANPDHQDS